MRRLLLKLCSLLAAAWLTPACAGGGSSSNSASRAKPELPSDLAPDVHEAERLGRAIFDQDLASSRASDALLRAMGDEPDTRIEGWITRRRGKDWLVEFFGPSEQGFVRFWQSEVKSFGAEVPTHPLDPPEPLDAEAARMARARATAIAQPFRACSSRYNTVVLPGSLIDKPGYLVYLLAATSDNGEWIVGGHQRFLITADGARVLQHRPLSRGCLAVPASQHKTHSSSAWVTHVVGDAPAETHVFLSLMHQAPLYVGTRRGIWKVAGEKISFEGS